MLQRDGRNVASIAASLAAVIGAACGPRATTDAEKLATLHVMMADVTARFPGAEQLTVDDVGRLLEADRVVLVDVREPREREVSWIPGSITAAEYEADPDAWGDRTVVAYCTIGHRSSEYAQRMSAEGHPVANLSGSILAWAHAGGPLVGPDGPTNRIHVYGRTWDLAPARYETVW